MEKPKIVLDERGFAVAPSKIQKRYVVLMDGDIFFTTKKPERNNVEWMELGINRSNGLRLLEAAQFILNRVK